MVSLIKIFLNLFRQKKIRKVQRLPSFKPLRAHILGLSVALLSALLNIIFNIEDHGIYTNILLISWFIAATYLSGFLVFLTLILLFSPSILALLSAILGFSPDLVSTLKVSYLWYLLGYCFGFTLAIFYNDFVYLFIHVFEKKKITLVFGYDPNKEINIIKSPNENEEIATGNTIKTISFLLHNIREKVYTNDAHNKISAEKSAQIIARQIRKVHGKMSAQDKKRLENDLKTIPGATFPEKLKTIRTKLTSTPSYDASIKQAEPLVEKYLKIKEKKLYHFDIESPPEQPYTIAFVANPTILKHGHHRDNPADYVDDDFNDDPIMRAMDLFLKSVKRGLQSFDNDDVVGKADILSRIRVVTVFDKDATEILDQDNNRIGKKIGLLEEFQENQHKPPKLKKPVIHYIADPRKEMHENVKKIMDAVPNPRIRYEELDVIYAITASLTHDRSMAHNSDYTEGILTTDHPPNENREGIEYTFDIDPCDRKKESILKPEFEDEPKGITQAYEPDTIDEVKGGVE